MKQRLKTCQWVWPANFCCFQDLLYLGGILTQQQLSKTTMANLPVQRMVLYKHGVGFFERYGSVGDGAIATLTFKKAEMNDILKSLAAFPQGDGRVINVSYDTPEDKQEALKNAPMVLGKSTALLDLLRSLRGRQVCLHMMPNHSAPGSSPESEVETRPEFTVTGSLIGIDLSDDTTLENTLVSILTEGTTSSSTPKLRSYLLSQVRGLDILDTESSNDLRYVLELSQANEDKRGVSILLDRANEELLVTYVAPTPTWRVSYRLAYKPSDAEAEDNQELLNRSETGEVFIQGWGIVDNQLDEDLDNVSLTLIAGQPISFVYDLYTPHFVERPQVKDEARTVPGPVMFEESLGPDESPMMFEVDAIESSLPEDDFDVATFSASSSLGGSGNRRMRRNLSEATQVQAAGVARGELFQYDVTMPVSIKRGQSAMVPILEARLSGRKQYLFNQAKTPAHPVVTIIATNTTSLTLERGPATVLEADDYVGEAVLAFTPAQGELFVPYAVDLGTTITTKVEEYQETAAITFGTLNDASRDQFFIHDRYQIRKTTYQIENRNTYSLNLMIEQDIYSPYEIFDMAAPAEITAEARRWQIPIQAKESQVFIVKERWRATRRERLLGLDYQTLKNYFNNRFIDQETLERLNQILEIDQDSRRIQKKVEENKAQDEWLSDQQESATSKLQRLDRTGQEGLARQKFVARVQQWESDREVLAQESQELEQQLESLTQQRWEILQRLATTE
ncbi:MAG: hypothetical protein ACHWZW_09060 [Spirulina sp.]